MTTPDTGTRFGTFVQPKTGSRPTIPQQQARKGKTKPGATTRRGADALDSPSAKWLHQRRAALAGLALAAPAYSRPLWWLTAATLLVLLWRTGRLLKPAVTGGALSPAALIVLPIRVVLAVLGAIPETAQQLARLLIRAAICLALATVATGGTALLYDAATDGIGCTAALDAIHRWAVPLGAYAAAAGHVAHRLKTRPGNKHPGPVRNALNNTGEAGLLALVAAMAAGAWFAYRTGWTIDLPTVLAEAADWNRRTAELVNRLDMAVLDAACQI